jgi:hypothetical protein
LCIDAESISIKFRRKKMKTTGVIVIALAMLIALTGVVMADQVVKAVPESQTISTSTAIIADGLVQDSAALAWTLSNQSITANPPLGEGQVEYTTVYDANTVAQAGTTTFVKTMAIDTRNKVVGQSNVKADTSVSFIQTEDGGNIVGSENILIDGVGNATKASDRMLCPFAAVSSDVIPQYCNIVQAGSSYDLIDGSVTTQASDRFVGSDATNAVVLNYQINVKPYQTSDGAFPAIGSAMAYVKAHIQEGRDTNNTKMEDLTYTETSSVTGTISSFQKIIAYQSGKSLI